MRPSGIICLVQSAMRRNVVAPIRRNGFVVPRYAPGCNLNPAFDLNELGQRDRVKDY